jgi:hypothetical protein
MVSVRRDPPNSRWHLLPADTPNCECLPGKQTFEDASLQWVGIEAAAGSTEQGSLTDSAGSSWSAALVLDSLVLAALVLVPPRDARWQWPDRRQPSRAPDQEA